MLADIKNLMRRIDKKYDFICSINEEGDINEKADGIMNDKGDYLWSSNSDSIPLFYDKDTDKAFVGNKGESHLQSLNQNEIPKELITGRYWINDNIIGFWDIMPSLQIINQSILSLKKVYDIDVDKTTLSVVVDENNGENNHKLVKYADFLGNKLLPQHWDSEEYKKDHILHLADTKTKHEKMKDFLDNRSKNIGKKLTMDNGEEMTVAQWRALHNTSENKNRTKKKNKNYY